MLEEYDVTHQYITPHDWQNAERVGGAVNVSGIVRDFADVVSRLGQEARERGNGTDWVNRHPIVVLYTDALLSLSGAGYRSVDAYRFVLDRLRELGLAPTQ